MKKKKRLPVRKELEPMREQKEEINRELEKEWKKEEKAEEYEEKKRVLSYEQDLLRRHHIKESFIKDLHKGRVRGKLTHIRRGRHGRMGEKAKQK